MIFRIALIVYFQNTSIVIYTVFYSYNKNASKFIVIFEIKSVQFFFENTSKSQLLTS